MNVSPQILDYNALAICTYNPTNKCDNYLWDSAYCCYYGNGVLHNTCNMCIRDLPVCMPSALGPAALGLLAYISGKSLMPMLQLLLELYIAFICLPTQPISNP